MSRLQDKVAIILGAAGRGNMGQVIARRFAAEGAKIVVAGRHGDELEHLAKELGGIHAICDITVKSDVEALAKAAIDAFGKVDVAVNATGWGYISDFLASKEEDIDRIMDLQFKGPIFFFQALVEAMTGGGSIIQISSATATVMIDNHAAYMGTKAGIDHVVRSVANDYGSRGIRANSISPGLTETPMGGNMSAMPNLLATFEAHYPLGRIGTSDDIAAAAVWLASDECFMTGQNLQVNGGLTLRGNPLSGAIASALQKDFPDQQTHG